MPTAGRASDGDHDPGAAAGRRGGFPPDGRAWTGSSRGPSRSPTVAAWATEMLRMSGPALARWTLFTGARVGGPRCRARAVVTAAADLAATLTLADRADGADDLSDPATAAVAVLASFWARRRSSRPSSSLAVRVHRRNSAGSALLRLVGASPSCAGLWARRPPRRPGRGHRHPRGLGVWRDSGGGHAGISRRFSVMAARIRVSPWHRFFRSRRRAWSPKSRRRRFLWGVR